LKLTGAEKHKKIRLLWYSEQGRFFECCFKARGAIPVEMLAMTLVAVQKMQPRSEYLIA
jgi:hypothetical protein